MVLRPTGKHCGNRNGMAQLRLWDASSRAVPGTMAKRRQLPHRMDDTGNSNQGV